MATSTITLGQHLTFDQQADAGHTDAHPCSCWLAGYGAIAGLTRDQVQHPDEFTSGAQASVDEALDL